MLDEQGRSLHSIPGGRAPLSDAAELSRLRAEVEARNRQEIAVAELGQAALTGVDPYILLGQACALIELTLGVTHCRALESTPSGQMLVRASIGANETFVHCDHDGEENESIGMLVILGDEPLTFGNLEQETRFKSGHLRQYHGVRSGIAVVIRAQRGPFGALLAYSVEDRTFEEYEIAFLRSTANILGEALSRARTEHALRNSESRLRQLIAAALDAVITIDCAGNVVDWNPQAAATFGLTAREVLGRPIPPLLLPPRMQRTLAATLDRYRTTGRPGTIKRRIEAVARRASGEEFPVEITVDPIGTGSDRTFTVFVRDISERRKAHEELEQRERRFRTIVEKSYSGIALLDAELCFRFAGSSTLHLLGYREEDLVGTSLIDLVHPNERDNMARLFARLLDGEIAEAQGELRFRHSNGTWVWLEGFGQNMLGDPSVGAIVLNYRDVTQRKATEKQLEYHAYYDPLTQLPNRLLFRDRVVHGLAQARRTKVSLAVMYLDLDHFKLVNDGLGHSFGDRLLADAARRLERCIRASDTISRVGGDEFSILIHEVSKNESVVGIARKILASLERPFTIDDNELFVTASMGVAIHPADGDDVETLFKCADAALFRAKELGRNQVQLFTASINDRFERRLLLEQSLHHAIERGEMELWYQPIVEGPRRHVTSVEALIRWHDPRRGLVEPAEFITLAEETGLIVPIGEWVLRTAVRQLREWRELGIPNLRMAVNISAPQLHQLDFVDLVMQVIAENNVPPEWLQLEITESVAIQDMELATKVLRELKDRGVGIAIDDFGTGQSSLVYLKQLPIDTIKLDKEFLREIVADDVAAAIVSYAINLAHTLRLRVVAEGVEHEEQYSFLRLHGCDEMQGYLFSKPLPATRVQSLLRDSGSAPVDL